MCGRFTLKTSASDLVEVFQLLRAPMLEPRYNIAPSQPVAAVRSTGSARELVLLQWGLVPSWAKDLRIASQTINARVETAATKPAFRAAFRRRRCLIPADGFYEWQKGSGKNKQPFYITLDENYPFAFAGLWEHWQAPDGSGLETCTILTTNANERLRALHDRMPAILPEEHHAAWLDPRNEDPETLLPLLQPYPSSGVHVRPVSTLVNSPRHDSPACLGRASEQRSLF